MLERLRPSDAEVVDDLGRWYIRHIGPYRTATDRIGGVVVTFVEITERKRSEAAVRKSEERLRRVLETDAVGVLFFDEAGTLIDANDVFLHMTGYRRREVDRRQHRGDEQAEGDRPHRALREGVFSQGRLAFVDAACRIEPRRRHDR